MKAIVPCLWFDGVAEDAAEFYVSLLPDSHIDRVRATHTATRYQRSN